MRIIAHLISVLLLLPGLFVCAVLASFAHLGAQTNLLGLITALLDLALAFFPVVFLLFVAWFGIALMGFSTRLRQAGAIVVGVVAAATTAVILWRTGAYGAGTLATAAGTGIHMPGGIVVPGAFALVIAVWLASTEWPDPRERNARGVPATLGQDR